MFKNFSLRAKIISICLTLSAILLLVGGIGFYSLNQVSNNFHHVIEVNMANSLRVDDMKTEGAQINRRFLRMGLPGTTEEGMLKLKGEIHEAMKNFEKLQQAYLEIPFVEGEEQLYKVVDEKWSALKSSALEHMNYADSKSSADRAKFESYINQGLSKINGEFNKAMAKLNEFHDHQAKIWTAKANASESMGKTLSIVAVTLGFVFATLIGFFFSRSLSKALVTIAERLSSGATEVAAASQQISSSAEQLSASATEQAASLEETASSIEEMSAMVKKNAENSEQSRDVSTTSQETANRGKQVIDEMVHAIEEINRSNTEIMQQIETSNREISDIVKVIAEIGNKTKVINDIVFQTKLLSFNASVEAARAGEHGKGFAVVAEEVGNLAQMSGNAAKEISGMLEGSIQKVENIVTETKSRVEKLVATGKEKVESGTEIAKRCGVVLDEIVRDVTEVTRMTADISTASQEQAQGVQEITRAISQLDQVTQQNAAASEQAASSAEELSSQAEVLRTMVRDLMGTIHGASSAGFEASQSAGPQLKQRKAVASAKAHAPMKTEPKFAAKAPKAEKNVIPFKPKAQEKSASFTHAAPVKKASGMNGVPSENDPRFEDV